MSVEHAHIRDAVPDENGDRRAVRAVCKRHFNDGIFSVVNGLDIFKESVLFLKAGVPAVVDDKAHKSAVFEEGKSLFNCGDAGFLACVYGMVAARKPAEIEGYAGNRAFFGIFVHLGMTLKMKLAAVGKTSFCEKCGGAVNGVLLDIKAVDMSVFACKLAEKCGVKASPCGSVDADIALFYVLFEYCMANVEC